MWKNTGQQRPDFADTPGDGQESVWDYPRPPALVDFDQLIEVKAGNTVIASTRRAKKVCETASPPTYYLPPDDIDMAQLVAAAGRSFCEWKGAASYWALKESPGDAIGWSYEEPTPAFASVQGWLCFYPGRIACFIDGERVRPQEGGFYGGWVTDNIVGPWKGSPGSGGW